MSSVSELKSAMQKLSLKDDNSRITKKRKRNDHELNSIRLIDEHVAIIHNLTNLTPGLIKIPGSPMFIVKNVLFYKYLDNNDPRPKKNKRNKFLGCFCGIPKLHYAEQSEIFMSQPNFSLLVSSVENYIKKVVEQGKKKLPTDRSDFHTACIPGVTLSVMNYFQLGVFYYEVRIVILLKQYDLLTHILYRCWSINTSLRKLIIFLINISQILRALKVLTFKKFLKSPNVYFGFSAF